MPVVTACRKSAMMLGLAVVAAGCASAPVAERSIDARAGAAAFAARDLGDPGLASFMTRIGAPSVSEDGLTPALVTAAALYFHADAKLAAATIASARADTMIAEQRPNPVFSLTPERVINAAADTVPWVVAAALSLPFETNGKRDTRNAAATYAEQQAALTAAATLWQLRSKAVAALYEMADTNAELKLTEQEVSLRRELTARLAKQETVGLISTIDVLRARGEVAQATGRLADVRSRAIGARGALAAAMGVPVRAIEGREVAGLPDTTTGPRIDRARLDQLEADAIVNRVDLRAKLAAYAQTQEQLRSEIAKRLPDVTLGPGYTYDKGDKKIVLGVSFELPIFHGNDASVAKAKAERDRAAAAFEGVQGDVIAAVNKGRAAIDGATDAFQQAATATATAADIRDRLLEELKQNAASRPDVMQADLLRLQSAAAQVAIGKQLHAAMIQLEDAVATPIWTPALNLEAALPPQLATRSGAQPQ